jgi:3-oxoadipate enol-lactonase
MWAPQLENFSQSYRLLLYDHPGHGNSPERPAGSAIGDYGADVIALMDALEIQKAFFCGLSLGGMVGLWLGAHESGRFEKLVLCNTTAKIANTDLLRGRIAKIREVDSIDGIVDSVIGKWFTPLFINNNPAVIEDIRRMFLETTPGAYCDTSETVCNLDLRKEMSSISVPTLVVYGNADEATPPAWNRAIAESIRGARTEALETAHLSNVEAPRNFTQAVMRFLG